MIALRWSTRVIAIREIGKGESPAELRRCALGTWSKLGTTLIKSRPLARHTADRRGRLKGQAEDPSQPCSSDRARAIGEDDLWRFAEKDVWRNGIALAKAQLPTRSAMAQITIMGQKW